MRLIELEKYFRRYHLRVIRILEELTLKDRLKDQEVAKLVDHIVLDTRGNILYTSQALIHAFIAEEKVLYKLNVSLTL
jgi:Ca2+-binding EF-hand superfamily protein